MNVQRYELEIYHCNGGEMLVSETGDYVSHDDYAALEAKCGALAAELKQSQIDAGCYKKGMEASNERLVQVAAENAGLKAGPQGFFAYGSECGYEEFDTAEKAMEFAEAEIADFRDQACDGWSDEVGSVVWGVVLQRATMTGLRPVEEGDNCAEGFKEWCDYTLLPGIETPATNSFLAEVRAQGVEAAINNIKTMMANTAPAHHAIGMLHAYAAQLRQGGAQ